MGTNRCWFARVISLCALGLLMQAGDSAHARPGLDPEFTSPSVETINSSPAATPTPAETDKEPRNAPGIGDIVIAGGIKGAASTRNVQFYSFTSKKFIKTGKLNVDRAAACGLTLAVGPASNQLPLFIVGGAQAAAPGKGLINLTLTALGSSEEYGRDTAKFATMTAAMSQPRIGCTATPFNDGTVLITGGLDASGNPLNSAEIFDPATGTFTPTVGSMNSPRAFHTATLLTTGPSAGDVLITGGLVNNGGGVSGLQGITLNSAELYHPATGSFTPVSSTMSDLRAFHTATALSDGTVLIAGGASAGSVGGNFVATAAADIFDPLTQTFTPITGPLMEPLLLHGATLLPDGTVLITGGFDVTQVIIFSNGGAGSFTGSVAQGAEIYDPTTKAFSCLGGAPITITANNTSQTVCTSAMKHPHAGHAAVLLDDGTVLVAGGFGGRTDTKLAKTTGAAEVYHPTSKTFIKVGSMKPGVALGAATLPLAQEFP